MRSGPLVGVWVVLLAYGALVPFRLQLPETFGGVTGVLGWLWSVLISPRWVDAGSSGWSSNGINLSVVDVATNVALYVPLGIGLRLALAGRWRWPAQVGVATIAAAAVSWLLECIQSLMPDRVASLNDWLFNVLGGFAGALAAVWMYHLARRTVFALYCHYSYSLYVIRIFLQRQRHRPLIMLLVAVLSVALVVYWYADATAPKPGGRHAVNWLPFTQQFARSYDVAALQIGRMLVVYCLVAMLLSLQFLRIRQRRGLGWVVLVVAVLAAVREVIQFTSDDGLADVTGPIIAVMAVGFTLTTSFLLVHAVRCSGRRKRQMPVAVDRRRVPYKYRL
ncbi:MAG: VanZ family protein [Phycisphaeraceae bacterium]